MRILHKRTESEGKRIDIDSREIADFQPNFSETRARTLCQLVFKLIEQSGRNRQFVQCILHGRRAIITSNSLPFCTLKL